MARIAQLTPETADPEQRELLEATRKQLGRTPNLYAALANGPAALKGYLALRESLVGGVLDERLREQLALLIAQENGCLYCVSAHTMRGNRLLKMTDDELLATRRAEDADPHARAVLQITGALLRTRGRVDDDTLELARKEGVTDAELAEIVAHIALNTLSNYFNHLAEPDLDFPAVPSMDVRAAVAADDTAEAPMNTRLNWREGAEILLLPGYTLVDADGAAVDHLTGVGIAVEGGYLHVAVPGVPGTQMVSAPAVRRIGYPAARES